MSKRDKLLAAWKSQPQPSRRLERIVEAIEIVQDAETPADAEPAQDTAD